jgi:hypothetical protein
MQGFDSRNRSEERRARTRMESGCVRRCVVSTAVEDVRTFLFDEIKKPAEMAEKIREVLDPQPGDEPGLAA